MDGVAVARRATWLRSLAEWDSVGPFRRHLSCPVLDGRQPVQHLLGRALHAGTNAGAGLGLSCGLPGTVFKSGLHRSDQAVPLIESSAFRRRPVTPSG